MNGLAGNMQAEPRVFAHDAYIVYTDARTMWLDVTTLQGGSGYAVATGVATSGTGVPAALTVDITSINADGAITGIIINVAGTAGTDGSMATIAGGDGNANIDIRTTFPGSDERGACIYVGNSGDVEVLMEGGNTVVFVGVATGAFLPILAKQVLALNTDATDMLALYLDMWNGIGYTIPQKGDLSGGGSPIPTRFDILAEIGFPTELRTEDGLYTMEQEIAPH